MIPRPQHIGLIPDGNRRWAQANGLSYAEAYRRGMEKIVECLETWLAWGISTLSVYLLSRDNLARDAAELQPILAAEEWGLAELLPRLKAGFGARFVHAGRADLLPPSLLWALTGLCTDGGGDATGPTVNLCLGYDAADEIEQALRRAPQPAAFRDYLWVPGRVDLVLRTGSQQRLSGFLPLQSQYAEFIFEPYNFPDITPARLQAALDTFARRQRTYGR